VLADTLTSTPVDASDVSRRAIMGMITRTVVDEDVDEATWRGKVPDTVALLNGQ